MPAILAMPPVTVTVGLPFKLSLRIEDATASEPILDLTGYEVAFSLASSLTEAAFYTGAGTVVDDHAVIEISETDTAIFEALPVLLGRPSAILQITLTAPVALNSIVLQGPVTIQGIIA